MVNSTHIVNTKRLKVLRNRSDYITSRSRVVVHNFTEIGSLILSGQIGEVLVFFSYKHSNKFFRLVYRLQIMYLVERLNA